MKKTLLSLLVICSFGLFADIVPHDGRTATEKWAYAAATNAASSASVAATNYTDAAANAAVATASADATAKANAAQSAAKTYTDAAANAAQSAATAAAKTYADETFLPTSGGTMYGDVLFGDGLGVYFSAQNRGRIRSHYNPIYPDSWNEIEFGAASKTSILKIDGSDVATVYTVNNIVTLATNATLAAAKQYTDDHGGGGGGGGPKALATVSGASGAASLANWTTTKLTGLDQTNSIVVTLPAAVGSVARDFDLTLTQPSQAASVTFSPYGGETLVLLNENDDKPLSAMHANTDYRFAFRETERGKLTVRRDKVVKLPYDREVKSLVTDGLAYINLGFKQDAQYRIEAHVTTHLVPNDATHYLFGACSPTSGSHGTHYAYGGNSGLYLKKANPAPTITLTGSFASQTNTLIVVDAYAGTMSGFGGETAISEISIASDQNFLVFASRHGNRAKSGTEIHEFKYTSDTRDLDLIPVVKNVNGTEFGFFYDRANPNGGPNGNGLYGNASTSGAFTWIEL